MKKIYIIILTISLFFNLKAQKNIWWFSLSPYIGTGSSLFIHKESMQDNNLNYHLYSPSHMGGIKFSIAYNQNIGFNLATAQHYDSQIIDLYDTRNNVNIHEQILHKYLNFAFFIDFQTNTGLFLDFGTTLAKTQQTAIYSPTGDFKTVDVSAQMPKFYYTMIIRTGFKPYMSQILDITTGIQLNYTLQSLITDEFYFTSNYFIHRLANYHDPTLTLLNAYLFIGVEYYFGYYGRSSCGKSSFLWNRANPRRFR